MKQNACMMNEPMTRVLSNLIKRKAIGKNSRIPLGDQA